jgi:hypothetical protein
MSLLKLHADSAGEAAPDGPHDGLPGGLSDGLRGEKLAEVSVDEAARWSFGQRVLTVLGLAALAWLAVLYLPGLLNDLIGRLLGLLVQTMT